jgi:hypothetical protein
MFKKRNKETENKKIVDKELELYRQEKILDINAGITETIVNKKREVQELALQCANQVKEYEHEFHSKREGLRVELAKLDSEIELKKELQEKENKALNREIDLLREALLGKNEIIKELLKKVPEIKEINCNCNK